MISFSREGSEQKSGGQEVTCVEVSHTEGRAPLARLAALVHGVGSDGQDPSLDGKHRASWMGEVRCSLQAPAGGPRDVHIAPQEPADGPVEPCTPATWAQHRGPGRAAPPPWECLCGRTHTSGAECPAAAHPVEPCCCVAAAS